MFKSNVPFCVHLQGEFRSRKNPHPTELSPSQTPPLFAETDKMVYILVNDYVLNTASLVYHEEGQLRRTIRPEEVRKTIFYHLGNEKKSLRLGSSLSFDVSVNESTELNNQLIESFLHSFANQPIKYRIASSSAG